MHHAAFTVVCAAICLTGSAFAADGEIPFETFPGDPLRWYDARELGVVGRGWTEVKEFYDRLPAKAEGVVREPVWNLSRNSSGMYVDFVADTSLIAVRWGLRSPTLAMPHMAATGVSGVDLYGRTEDGTWRWIAVGKPAALQTKATLVSSLPMGSREYRIYLPLYNGVTRVQIGLPAAATIRRVEQKSPKPIVFYGTSIMQGACASRTGMAQSSIIGRRLDTPVINLGFSGNGKMEPEIAQLLAELDPSVYVIDALPNMEAALVKERAETFVRTLREARPTTPIILVEDRTYADAHWIASRRERNETSRREFRAAYDRLVKSGISGLTYIEGNQLLRSDGEDTVDGSHPTDLGFMRYADVVAPYIAKVLDSRLSQ
ncbi:MAG: SGNH/GDSL hydrolase family protein [Planctomycetes bacterium]|nr:SGNH/GDSL hydrolase family protein [Planctomycetota bacterium]